MASVSDKRKKALLLFPHGIGDTIMAMPCLRTLYHDGYTVDMIVRDSVITSRLLDECPYTDMLYKTESASTFVSFTDMHFPLFEKIKSDSKFDWTGAVYLNHKTKSRVKLIAQELELQPKSCDLEVFIPDAAITKAKQFLASRGIKQFIFVHTCVPRQPRHNWCSNVWVKKSLPRLPILDTRTLKKWDDINVTFALMSMAKYRVLSSSVMVHACDAMDCRITAANYHRPNNSCLPLDKKLIRSLFIDGQLT